MENTIDIKNWETGKVIFSYTCENNTIEKTVEKAVKQGVNLTYANLKHYSLDSVNFKNVDLSYADLSYSIFYRCDFSNAKLIHTDLSMTVLSSNNLSYADLSYAKLNKTIIVNGYLENLYLNNADLTYANLEHANLNGVVLDNVKGLNNQCPKEGSFIAWKKCYSSIVGPVIVKLEIPADAKRSSSTGIKCRCDKAKVLEIQNLDGTKVDINEVRSYFDKYFKYRIRGMRRILDFDERYWIECARGIHFFMNREDAVKFNI